MTSEPPSPPATVLEPDELERFLHTCSRERKSPTTQRVIDAASYGWLNRFIRNVESGQMGNDWLAFSDALPDRISDFFARVAIRSGGKPSRPTTTFPFARLPSRSTFQLPSARVS